MKAPVISFLLIFLFIGFSSSYGIPIDDIQVYDAGGAPASPYDGLVVTVTGSVFVPQGVFNSGSFYILGETGGINVFAGEFLFLDLGEVVELQGVVSSFQGTIQIGVPVTVLSRTPGPVPEPVFYLPEEIPSNYELVGHFVTVMGEVVDVDPPYIIFLDAGEDDLIVYLDATAGLSMDEVGVGDTWKITGAVYNYLGMVEIYPRYQDDLEKVSGVVAGDFKTWGALKAMFR